MGAEHHALGRFLGREAGTQREARADALGHRHDVGRQAILLMGEEGAGTGIAALHLVQDQQQRSEEHTSELQSLMRISYAVFCLKKKKNKHKQQKNMYNKKKYTHQYINI